MVGFLHKSQMVSEQKCGGVPSRKTCFAEDIIVPELGKFCSKQMKTPFSWWCSRASRPGYQFQEGHETLDYETQRKWQPIHAEKRDDTWPFNCDPLRCVKMPACLQKLIYGDRVFIKKPCKKYRLKAPLFSLPENMGTIQEKTKYFKPKQLDRRENISYDCKVHCNCINEEANEQCRSDCSIQRELVDSHFDQFSQAYSENIKHMDKIQTINPATRKTYSLDNSKSCPTKTCKNCSMKQFMKDFCSYQELVNKKKEEKESGNSDRIESSLLKYLRCFNLEKETLEYIHQCICDSQSEEDLESIDNDSSTNVLFEKEINHKFEKLNSILEISENLEAIIGLVDEKISTEITDNVLKKRFAKLLHDKVNNLNRIIITTEKMRKAIKDENMLAFKQPEKQLFSDKLQQINSIIEFIVKMEAAIESNDFSAFPESVESNEQNYCKKDVNNNNVDIIYQKTGESSSYATTVFASGKIQSESYLKDKNNERQIIKNGSKFQGNPAAITRMQNPVNIDQEVLISDKYTPVIRIDIGLDGEKAEVMKTSVQYSSTEQVIPSERQSLTDGKNSLNSGKFQYISCPSSYFEIDSYLKSLRALITTYDPFLSPYSPMRNKLFSRRYHKPKKTVTSKKCFPMSQPVYSYVPKKKGRVAFDNKFPISEQPSNRIKTSYHQSIHSQNIGGNIGSWKQNWTGRKCTNYVVKNRCPFRIQW